MSRDRVSIGFIPLVDAAIPLMAADLGFGADEGLDIALVREVSWANVRDRLIFGHFDAAHMLAPLAIATSLGLGGIRVPLAAPMALGLNGNAITLAPALHEEVSAHFQAGADTTDPRVTAAAFGASVRARRSRGAAPPTLGMTFPYSTHNYQLRLWLEAAGLTPDEDVPLVVVPPPFMVDALAHGRVEGFCVGAPWNSLAVELGLGRILHLGVDLVRRCPEKVLAMRVAWQEEHSETAARLTRALARAGHWLGEPENRDEAAARLAATDRLDVPAAVISRTLEGRLPTGVGETVRRADDYMLFAGATRPDPRHAAWLFSQMTRWMQADPARAAEAEAVYRPDLYDAAVGSAPEAPRSDFLGVFSG